MTSPKVTPPPGPAGQHAPAQVAPPPQRSGEQGSDLVGRVQAAPHHIVPGRPVPQPADQEGDEQVGVPAQRTRPAAAQRNVQVVPQPAGQRDVPPAPEFPDRLGQIGLAEVFPQREAQHLGRAQRDVAVAGKVGVDLHRVQHGGQQPFHPAVGRIVGKDGVHHQCGLVGHHELFKVAPQHPHQAVPHPVGQKDHRPGQLGQQGAAPGDGPRDDLGKEAQKQGVPHKAALRRQGAPVHVGQVPQDLEGGEADAQRQQQ